MHNPLLLSLTLNNTKDTISGNKIYLVYNIHIHTSPKGKFTFLSVQIPDSVRLGMLILHTEATSVDHL